MNELEIIGNKAKESLQVPLTFSTPAPKNHLHFILQTAQNSLFVSND